MTFEIRRLICDIGICRRMGFVESIGGKGGHIVKYLIGNLCRYSPFDAAVALNASVLTHHTVNKVFAFLFHYVVLFFGHCTANYICPSVGITRKRAEYLHYLLLIYHTAVGNFKDISELFGFIYRLFRVMPVFYISVYRVHRTRAVK